MSDDKSPPDYIDNEPIPMGPISYEQIDFEEFHQHTVDYHINILTELKEERDKRQKTLDSPAYDLSRERKLAAITTVGTLEALIDVVRELLNSHCSAMAEPYYTYMKQYHQRESVKLAAQQTQEEKS